MAKNDLPVLESAATRFRRDVPQHPGDEPGMTRQEFAAECDINSIMARYEKTGMLPVNQMSQPQYLDLTMTPDTLMDAMNLMIDAENAFMTLPAMVRKEFDNDPMRFVEFASDPNNVKRLREWGLAEPEKEAPLPELGSAERPISIVPVGDQVETSMPAGGAKRPTQ